MMATDEEAVDGAAVLSGKRGDEDVLVVFLSQFKSIKATTDISSETLDNSVVTKVLTGMKTVGDELLKVWLAKRVEEGVKVEFVCDIFSDKEVGPRFKIDSVSLGQPIRKLPRRSSVTPLDSPPQTVLFITSRKELKEVVGPVLHVRGSLKRPLDSAVTSEKKKVKKEEED
ncbi:hypothetical protein BASA81_001232 [Batrachochytrium salamandrivorans]|nr:hypothetical protein BASA81_001232 [Batrachochytrium salamandrivorans]